MEERMNKKEVFELKSDDEHANVNGVTDLL
ncbi:MAG: hypothetical protein K0R15_1718 [Clostridiales bacterium]|jgi:hypothetical protein|nr:hypothetical protein [Clostridiales bacterium]